MMCEFEKKENCFECKFCHFKLCAETMPNIYRACPSDIPRDAPISFIQKAINFGGALVEHAKTGFENVSEEEQKKRMDICKACDKFDKATETCQLCGCPCNRKTAWKSSSCPKGSW